ncbi:hypothetical protein GJA_4848 [Janthinobacterium agaricidamnosum NBRC 102515 = DSM 9628]|uniref:Uncharacterized protein n=1 Tax=Janthinobacterium agaricidamnosum NBRC 102515 = DSM 9628 TaxID=1349767 RepID=W0VDU3_9BURK|nr:hypothetical protein GJA_4848 [Janthinobacterium agaricidamnosum NBRC 102515 = DSM 9628]
MGNHIYLLKSGEGGGPAVSRRRFLSRCRLAAALKSVSPRKKLYNSGFLMIFAEL